MSPRAETVLRRSLTVPLYLGLATISVVTLPIWLVVLGGLDLARRRRLASLRCGALFTLLFVCEAAGILICFWLWLASGPWRAGRRDRHVASNFRLQWWWASTMLGGAARILDMRILVSGEDAVRDTPMLLFLRHASMIDTILPVVLVSARHRIQLRYVLKRELLWDPSIDIVGMRTPNHFVDRTPERGEAEIAAVGRLAEDLGAGEGVVIFPEGTRFSPAKRAQIIDGLRKRGRDADAERAERLQHVLPPRPGGPLALLEQAPNTDVVFCSHTGFEGAARLSDLWKGELIGRTIHIRFWRVPAAEIPRETEARREWLFDQWEAVDAWVAEVG